MWITKYFIENKKLTNLLLIFILVSGFLMMKRLPRQDMPNVDFNIISISTFYPGASPEDVEINVTDKIEDELEGVDGIKKISSFSIEEISLIIVELDPDLDDPIQTKTDIRSAVDRVSDLPEEINDRPFIEEVKSTDFPILEIAIMGGDEQEDLLRKIALDLESEIKSVGKVGAVDRIAYRKKEVKVLCDRDKMESNHISFAEILNSIRSHNIKSSGGTLESFVNEKKIVTFSEFENLYDVGDVIVRSNFSGKHIKVKDIASIKEGYEKKHIICRTNSQNSINLIVKRRGTTDVIRLSNKIDSIIKKFQETAKESGVEIVKVVDYTYYTKSLLNIVTKNALIGFILVVISLFIFLNLRTAFYVALGIPVSIMGAYLFFPIFDVTTNQLTLITLILVLGMLVDDAIVIAENISRYNEDGHDIIDAAILGTKEVFKPVMATITTTILCFSPILFMSGILGDFIACIPIVIILTLLMSLFESVALLPAHLSVKNFKANGSRLRWMNLLRNMYASVLKVFLRFKIVTLILSLSLLVGSFFFFSKNSNYDLFPTEDFDIFYVIMEAEMGTSLEETFKKVSLVEDRVKNISDSLKLGYKTIIGDHRTDEAASDPSLHENWALITVFLHPASKRDKRSEDIIKELQDEFKGQNIFEKFEIREVQDGPPVGEPITLHLISDEFSLCEQYEKNILEFLRNMEGVYDIESSNIPGKDEVRLRLNYDFMAKVGITSVDLADTIRIAYDGQVATTISKNGEEIDFRVQLSDEQRKDISVLEELQVLNRENRLIKIKEMASFEKGKAKQSITHYNGKKAITITAKVKDGVITSRNANKVIIDRFEKEISLIPGLNIEFGGEEKETAQSMQNFMVAFFCGVLGIYFVLVLLLDSYFQPFLIMMAIPFGIIGVLIVFYLHGLPMSFMGGIGTLGMMGVVVNDSLVMVTYLNSMKKKNKAMSSELIIEGAKTRLRPVLLTTITTVFGLLPSAYGWGGTEPFLVPMVLAMSWGLLFATIITLVLIPVLYSLTSKRIKVS